MRLSRFLIASFFFLFFSFGIQTQALAQVAIDPTCTNSPSPTICTQCKASSTFFSANYEQCRVAVSGYNTSPTLPYAVIKQIQAECASFGITCPPPTTSNSQISKSQTLEVHAKEISEAVTATLFLGGVGGGAGTSRGLGVYFIGPPPNGVQVAYYKSGAVGTATNYIAKISGDKIINTQEYVADVYNNMRFPGVQPAYAQGLGFSSLSPVLGLWKMFRNLAYFFFVVIFIVVGMMIMFRSKIGNQAAVTVQQALPKMIVSLLLVTFSYAIAGLMVDVMYLVIYLGIALFQGPGLSTSELTQIALSNNIVDNIFRLIGTGVVGSIAGALGNIVVGALSVPAGSPLDWVLQGGSNLIFTVVLAFALIISLFRVFFALLQAYIGIFFSIIFAPVVLLIGAFPGQNTFGSWLRSLIENLMVFPVLILLIFIANYFTKVTLTQDIDTLGFSPPQLGSNQTQGGFAVYKALIPFAAILAMPEVLKLTKGMMKGKIDLSMNDIKQNLKLGGQLGMPVVAGAAGLPIGAAKGAFDAVRYGQGNIIGRALAGATIGYKNDKNERVGGAIRGVGKGLAVGQKAAGFYDRALEGQLLDPSTQVRQFSELLSEVKAAKNTKKE